MKDKKVAYCYMLYWVFTDIRHYGCFASFAFRKIQLLNPFFYWKCYKKLEQVAILADMFHFIPEMISNDFKTFDEGNFWQRVEEGYYQKYKKQEVKYEIKDYKAIMNRDSYYW